MRLALIALSLVVTLPCTSAAQDPLNRPLIYQVPGMDGVRVVEGVVYKRAEGSALTMNVGLPAQGSASAAAPIIMFIHGGALGRNVKRPPTDWGVYQSYVRLAAASGFVGVAFNFRYYDSTKEGLDRAFSDVADAIGYVQEKASTFGGDPKRICLWAFSGGGPMLSVGLQPARGGAIRCLVSYYAILDAGPELGDSYSPASYRLAEDQAMPPVFIGRAGLDSPDINRSVDKFVARAEAEGFVFTIANHPAGRHGFDILDDDERSRAIIASTLDFVRRATDRAEVPQATRLAARVAALYTSLQRGDLTSVQRLADPDSWPGADATFLQRVISEDAVTRLSFALAREGQRAKALGLLEWLVGRYPASATALSRLADGYEAAGRREDSRKATGKLLQLLEGRTDLSAESVATLRKAAEERLKRLSEKTF